MLEYKHNERATSLRLIEMEMKMIKVKISATIANEYQNNSVYDFIDKAGRYNLNREQAEELLNDALFNVLHTDAPRGVTKAYSSLVTNLMAELGTKGA